MSTLTSIGSLTSSSSTSSLSVTGLASGLDWSTVISELADAERAPETQWEEEQSAISAKQSDFSTIQTDLTALQTDIEALQETSLYTSRSATTSNSSIAAATAAAGTTVGTYAFVVSQLATATALVGASGVNATLSSSDDVSDVTLATANLATTVTAGTFTVNGKSVTVATTDSLQDVFDAISTATSGEVTASYDSSTDKITLTDNDGNAITLGSAADTSNFLQAARLYNSSTSATSVTSSTTLGSVRLSATMSDADLSTTVSDGGSGDGEFTINGVSFSYDASSDSIQNIMDDINSSDAGVTIAYDSQNNRFTLTNNSTGNVGISLDDVTGNFLTAIGLTSGTTTSGQNLLYTLNGGTQQLTSLSNTISSDSSGITGLSVTVSGTGSFTATVSSDTSGLSSAIQQFVSDYNSVQTYISEQSTVTTSSDGTVTANALTGDMTALNIASNLRQLLFSSVSGNSIGIASNLGITSNSSDNTVTLDSDTLTSALEDKLNAIQSFFTDSTSGLATEFTTYLTDTIGDDGTLVAHQTALTTQYDEISTQITNLESKITSDKAYWTSEFEAMEEAESQVNQELTYLTEQVSSGAL